MKPIIFYSFRAALFLFLIIVSSNCATPGLDTLVSFDTSWTLVYDGGKDEKKREIADEFGAAVPLSDGSIVCSGSSGDTSSALDLLLLMKIDKSGNIDWKKLYSRSSGINTGMLSP